MATATKKGAVKKKAATKRSASKKGTSKGNTKKNKLGVKNSLVNNINAHKKKGDSKSRKKSTINKEAYENMEQNWGRKE
jgi:hypothetical protein